MHKFSATCTLVVAIQNIPLKSVCIRKHLQQIYHLSGTRGPTDASFMPGLLSDTAVYPVYLQEVWKGNLVVKSPQLEHGPVRPDFTCHCKPVTHVEFSFYNNLRPRALFAQRFCSLDLLAFNG